MTIRLSLAEKNDSYTFQLSNHPNRLAPKQSKKPCSQDFQQEKKCKLQYLGNRYYKSMLHLLITVGQNIKRKRDPSSIDQLPKKKLSAVLLRSIRGVAAGMFVKLTCCRPAVRVHLPGVVGAGDKHFTGMCLLAGCRRGRTYALTRRLLT